MPREMWEKVEQEAPQKVESWSEGDVLIGVFDGLAPSPFKNDDGTVPNVARFTDSDGETVVKRCPAILDRILSTVKTGKTYRIVCKGKVKTKAGRMAWDFDVFAAK